MNALTLAQTSPATNPDKNIIQVTVTGNYVSGTADTLPLGAIADPQVLVQVPITNPGDPFLPVTPYVLNCFTPGFYAVVQRVIAEGVISFGLRWFQESTNAELASGAYPAAILNGEIFLEILCPTVQQ